MNKKKLVVVAAIIVFIGAFTAWLFLSGRLALVVKSPQDTIVSTPTVCSGEIVTKYNSAFDAETEDEYNSRIKEAYDMMATLDRVETDPNCVFIAFSYNIRSKNYDEARKNVATLKQLEENGSYVTSQIANPQSTTSMQNMVDAIDTTNDQAPKPSSESADPATSNGRG